MQLDMINIKSLSSSRPFQPLRSSVRTAASEFPLMARHQGQQSNNFDIEEIVPTEPPKKQQILQLQAICIEQLQMGMSS
jgi:hypothetical protein